ncbi:uncharacterized protein LOC143475543 [Brachyhypopomus gauderio]|uniref:uncharacterized protein LOC143475543 n=1 Tax=Brachyhypopomus gauderio TaxID=698409 RepID=UPI0040436D40
MRPSTCLLPVLVFCCLIDELYSFLLPDKLRFTRSPHRHDEDLSPHLSELSDLTELVPDNGGEMTQDWEPHPARMPPALPSTIEHIPALIPNTHRHKSKDKSVRVTVPLDRIGSSYLSSRHRTDEPEENWEQYIE